MALNVEYGYVMARLTESDYNLASHRPLFRFLVRKAGLNLIRKRRPAMSDVKCRILCVDDHQDTSEMLQLLLSDEDYEVETCGTMEEARQLAESREFDLYVLDKRLPDGTGLELCKTLNLLTPGVPCIFYSGDAYEIHRHEAIQAGAADYVAKPNLDTLIESVRKLLSERECAAAT